jgi:hypothetical protein
MNAAQARAFSDELSKSAAAPELLRRIWNSSLGRSLAGGAAGAGAGALTSPEDPRGGALRGALLGGLGGFSAPIVTRAGRQKAREAVGRFGKAQWHGLTGRGSVPVKPGMKPKEVAELARAEKAGLTSVPGLVKGLVGKDRKKVLQEAWKQSGKMGKLMGAADIAMTIPTVRDPNVEGGEAEKALRGLGSAGGYFLGSRMPLVGSMLFASGTGALGKYLGRGVDKLRGYSPPPQTAPRGQVVPGLGPKGQFLLDQSGVVNR